MEVEIVKVIKADPEGDGWDAVASVASLAAMKPDPGVVQSVGKKRSTANWYHRYIFRKW